MGDKSWSTAVEKIDDSKQVLCLFVYHCRALGLGATRGRLYIKHPDLFKVKICNMFMYNFYLAGTC